MWTHDIEDSIVATLKREIKRKKLLFVQLNPLMDSVIGRMHREGGIRAIDCSHTEIPRQTSENLVILLNFDRIAHDSLDAAAALGRAREAIYKLLDDDTSVCITSAMPRLAYPACIGSAVVEDANFFHPDKALLKACTEHETVVGPVTCWPDAPDSDLILSYLSSLGLDVLSALDYLVFDLRLMDEIPAEFLSADEWDALRGAGLYSVGRDRSELFHVTLTPAMLGPCLSEAISEQLGVQPDYGVVMNTLVEIERRIRRELRRRAVAKFGPKWRGQTFGGDLPDRICKRAAVGGTIEAVSVKSLRDPFEWLTLGELLEFVENSSFVERLGAPADFWSRFAMEILPIRNRVTHMRLLRADDARTVQYWRHHLRFRFSDGKGASKL